MIKNSNLALVLNNGFANISKKMSKGPKKIKYPRLLLDTIAYSIVYKNFRLKKESTKLLFKYLNINEITGKRIKELIKEISEILKRIRMSYNTKNDELYKLLKMMFTKCIKFLGDVPCKYCIYCVGSYGRKEETPYSDLEWFITIEHEIGRDYMIKMTVLVHYIMIMQEETTLRIMNISDKQNTMKGFAPDGSSMTPLGNAHNLQSEIYFNLVLTDEKLNEITNYLIKDIDYPCDPDIPIKLMGAKRIILSNYRPKFKVFSKKIREKIGKNI